MRSMLIAFGLIAYAVGASAHHSRAEFANETLEITGVITRVEWRNPHIAIFVDIEADDGSRENWRIEGFTRPAALERAGVRADLFNVGERITAFGDVSRFRNAILASNLLLDNGIEALMDAGVARHWAGPVVGDFAAPEPRLADAAADDRGFFRVWYPAGNPMRQMMRFPFTERAVAARRDWDPVDNPIVRCEQPGLPGTLFHPRPIEFTRIGNDIGLRHSFFDTQRVIHMGPHSGRVDADARHLGYSSGRWEDERTLAIETTDIEYPYFDNRGTIQGRDIALTERYTLSADQSRLDLTLTIEDPVSLAEPVTGEWHFLSLDAPFEAYECNVF